MSNLDTATWVTPIIRLFTNVGGPNIFWWRLYLFWLYFHFLISLQRLPILSYRWLLHRKMGQNFTRSLKQPSCLILLCLATIWREHILGLIRQSDSHTEKQTGVWRSQHNLKKSLPKLLAKAYSCLQVCVFNGFP